MKSQKNKRTKRKQPKKETKENQDNQENITKLKELMKRARESPQKTNRSNQKQKKQHKTSKGEQRRGKNKEEMMVDTCMTNESKVTCPIFDGKRKNFQTRWMRYKAFTCVTGLAELLKPTKHMIQIRLLMHVILVYQWLL